MQNYCIIAFRSKCPDVEIESLVFHQGNDSAHRAQETIMTVDLLGFERLDHSPYSPNLAPTDFAIFPKLKGDLRGRRFERLTDLKRAVQIAFGTLSEDCFFLHMYVKWRRRHEKCVTAKGEYFEKKRKKTSASWRRFGLGWLRLQIFGKLTETIPFTRNWYA